MATRAAKATKEVKVEHGESNPAPVRKGRLTDYWEKNPIPLLTVLDRRAVLK